MHANSLFASVVLLAFSIPFHAAGEPPSQAAQKRPSQPAPLLKKSAPVTTPPLQIATANANQSRLKIEALSAQVDAAIEELERALSQAPSANFNLQVEAQSLTALQKLIPLLREKAVLLNRGYADFAAAYDLYLAEVGRAPATFEVLARAYSQAANEESHSFFKAQYLDMEKRARATGSGLSARTTELEAMFKTTEQKRLFIDKSIVFLDRLEGFLRAMPDPAAMDEMVSHLKQIDSYITQFERVLRNFHRLNDRVQKTNEAQRKSSAEPAREHNPFLEDSTHSERDLNRRQQGAQYASYTSGGE